VDGATTVEPASWISSAAVAFWRFWKLKFLGSVLFSGLFFVGYFALLKHPAHAVTTMPVLAIDRAIPFRPQAIWIYFSLWLYLEMVPALLVTKRELWSYILVLIVMVSVAFVIFFLWPTQVPDFSTDWTDHTGYTWLKRTDAAGNACPSLHVAFALFTARWLHVLLRRFRAGPFWLFFNWAWSFAIIYSTLATRQHVAIDVLAGGALGTLAAALHLNWMAPRDSAVP